MNSTSPDSGFTDPGLRQTHAAVLLFGLVISAFALAFFGASIALSSAVGAAIAWANLWFLSRSVSRLLGGAGGSWALLFVVKFGALLLLTYFLIDREIVVPLGLALGFGALPLGVVVGGFLSSGTSAARDASQPTLATSPVGPDTAPSEPSIRDQRH